MRKMQALEESHADLKAGMQQRHAQQIEETKKEHDDTIAEYDAALAQRDTLITEGHGRIAELEQQMSDGQARPRRSICASASSRRGSRPRSRISTRAKRRSTIARSGSRTSSRSPPAIRIRF